MTTYCPICGEKDSVEVTSELKGKCNKCFNVVNISSILDNVKEAYPVWLKYQHDLANNFRERKK